MKTFLILILAISIRSCDNGNTSANVNWNSFKIGVIQKDFSLIEKEIRMLLVNTKPRPTEDDLIGQKSNIDKLIDEINKSGVLISELHCYACIETCPEQSEIRVITDSSGVTISRIIDIMTPDNSVLVFSNIHDEY